ncbi:MAG: hypothetical protein ACJAVP_002512 [Spirosomataceae bacterium]
MSSYISKLGVDSSDWRYLEVITKNNRISLRLYGETLIENAYEEDIGEIAGLQLYFKGTGFAKNMKLNGKSI